MGTANNHRFTAADIRRAIRAVKAVGESVAGVDFPREGGFRILTGEPIKRDTPAGQRGNEWDDVLAS